MELISDRSQPLKGIAMKLCSVTILVVMSALIKAAADEVPPGEAVFFRSFFAIPVILAWLALRGELGVGLATESPMAHVWRGLVGTSAMGLIFTGLGLLPLSEVQAIQYAAPLLVVIFAAMFLGEQVRAFRLSAVALGLAGVLIVLSPRLTALSGGEVGAREAMGAVAVLAAAICAALAQVFVRKMVATESTSAIVFWFSVTATSLSLLTLPFGWTVPSPGVAATLVAAGLLGGVGQILLTSCYRYADASVVAPFDYASILFAIGIGYAWFDEVPTLTVLAGAALVILAGVLIIWRERQLGLKRGKARQGVTPQG
ncbi:DMT family transporter [Tranquillimonas alkanivorans]|uniref:Permease of the drug/metabolite transporter (DMT) superfamily n=1 Tax=Tranquillimonas alkanivorans TaxID=441119 RepID=A0A1I5U2R1_9RHOB|nr:DMT family transporter [Tranquillimonas alkanivorans]SFP89461.1 Permease of the drug/metabolite transporter (DMT) superfamily [Tranquillimonas alkanivorans]